ncbi:MAG: lipopolysaccharide kinase InaA family protein [Anaerolineaceae bacterium]|nr:lipopolysaccharide kinase InaA family protein [Anaerolineaceae bacterium]
MTILKKNNFWSFLGHCEEKPCFETIQATLQQTGDTISKDPISQVVRADINNQRYFIKQYHQGGKGVRRFFGRSRAEGEWSNLLYFASLDIPTPRIVAYGRAVVNSQKLEVLVTAGVEDSIDLATLARQDPEIFKNRNWFLSIMQQVAEYTQRLHDDGFIHWDLKWRNILVQHGETPKVYFFDCPLGRHWYGWIKYRGAIKDLGCLDLEARKVLTQTQRLWFYLYYRRLKKLNPAAKRQIIAIDRFLTAKAKRKAARK